MIKLSVGLTVVFPALLAAQPDMTIRATTRLVEVTVVAQGKYGVPVRDLKRENVRVFDEGKPQKVSFFGISTPGLPGSTLETRAAGGPAAQGAPSVYTNRNGIATGPSAATIILIDTLNTGWSNQIYVKQAVVGFLRQIQPGDRVGVYAIRWPGYLRILYDLTEDSSELVKRLSAWKPDLSGASRDSGSFQESDLVEGMADILRQGGGAGDLADLRTFAGFSPSHNSRQSYADMPDRGEDSLKLFAAIARHLAAIPGRKNLIWVSAGFPVSHESAGYDRMLDATQALDGANVALYAVDARGLVTLQADATVRPPLASASGRTGAGARVFDPRWAQRVGRTDNTAIERTQAPMLEMSDLTGGRAFLNTNDVQGAIRTAAEEASLTYTLGFYPASPRHDGKFHRIEVRVLDRPNVSVRYRKGYVDAPDPANDPQGRTAAIRDAAWSPLDATGVALSAEVVPTGAADRYDLRLRIDPRTLDLQQERDQFNGRVDVVLVQKDHEGGQFDQLLDTMVLALKPGTYQRALTDGLAYSHAVQLDPKANELRVIVRDAFSGNVGSLTIPVKAFRAQQ